MSSGGTPFIVFTGDGGPLPGGVVVFGEEQDVSALRRLGGQSFTAAQAELAPAAVSWPGLPGVLGFRLDDGHVVYGDVKIRGENGCTVATYIDEEGDCRLRISAVGRKVEATTTTGFITSVVADSDNTNFTVKKDDASDYVIDIQPTGVTTMIDGMLNADQENMCSQVKTAVGTSSRVKTVEMAECEDGICASTNITRWKITLFDGNGNKVTWTADAEDSYITALTGGELSPLLSSQIPGNAVLPYDSRVAYVENSGAQYIDTGIKYRPSMSIRLKFTRVDMGTSGSVVLATTTTTPLIYLPALNNSSKTDRYVWRRPSVPEQSHTVTFADYPYSAEVYVDAQNDILYIDGIARKTGMIAGMNGYSSPYESASNIYLFSIAGSYWGHSQIYYLKIEENGVAIRDFIPVRKDGAGYMYDRVSRQLFGPQAGAAPLTYGDDVAAASSASLHNGLRFAGYYDDSGVMYYRYDGTPVRRFTADHDVALHAERLPTRTRSASTEPKARSRRSANTLPRSSRPAEQRRSRKSSSNLNHPSERST